MHPKMSDFILAIHDASMHLSPAEFHHWTLKEIRQYIDFDFAIWGAGNGQSRELHMATILDQTDTLFDTWETVKHEDPYANLVIGNTGKTWSIEQLSGFRQSRAYHEHWGLYHARQMISTMELDARTGLHIFVTLARESQRLMFSGQDTQTKHLITQHLFLAARHNDMHNLRTHQAPAAFVDRRGLLHASLPEFTALLTSEWGRQAGQFLPAHVTRALWQQGHYHNHRISLNAERFHNRLLVRAGIVPRINLSAREKEIAWAYAGGNSHKEVAKMLGISPTTVRTHLARVYQKLSLSDKGALAIWLKENS
jgi:DNA-binding CsgD family transcriptional regulator